MATQILVTGGAGMIGRSLPFGAKLSREEMDVTDERRVRDVVSSVRPFVIIHLAALDIRQCEARPRDGYAVNVLGSYHVALAAKDVGARLLFLSSGAVFNGSPGAVHTESSRPAPLNVFGQTKQIAELLLRETLEDVLIIRTGWVFGGHQAHHRKFVDVAIGKALRGEPIRATNDQWGSPTYVGDLADEIERLAFSSARGLIHVVNEGAASGVDIANEIVRVTGSRSEVTPVGRRDIPDPGPPRPESEVLGSAHQRLRPWPDALAEYVRERVRPGSGVVT